MLGTRFVFALAVLRTRYADPGAFQSPTRYAARSLYLMQNFQWHLLDELDSAAKQRCQEAIPEFLAVHPQATLDHDPNWLESRARAADRMVRQYVCLDSNGELIAFAPFFVHPSSFSFAYAGFTLLKIPIRRFSITAEPLLRFEGEDAEHATTALLTRMHKDLGNSSVMFALGLHLETPLGQMVRTGAASDYLLMPHGPSYQRRLARVERTLDKYLAKIGPKTRADLRRQERRLAKQANDQVQCDIVGQPESIPQFLSDVETVSRRTYQWNLLGSGIKNTAETCEVLQAVAARGWFRGYVLRCQGAPAAFMIGYVYRDVYLSESIGYDPDWAEWSVGNVLHLHVMRDLGSLDGKVAWFDFLYGDNSNKERLSTDAHWEQNTYLIPRTLRWRLIVATLRAFDCTTDALSRLLERYQVKQKIRRALRRRSTRATKCTDEITKRPSAS